MSLPVVILAGGLATRLGPLTASLPKSLVDIAGQPFAVHQIELLRRHGLVDVVFMVSHLGEMIRDTLGDGSRWGVRLSYVFDGPRPLGTGGAIREALPVLGDRFFVMYGDSYLETDYAAVERTWLASGKRGVMTVYLNDNRLEPSNVLFEEGRIVRYDKVRPSSEMRHIDYGLGAFHASAFAVTGRGAGDAFDLAEVYQDLLADDDLAGVEAPHRFYEIGSPSGLEETRAYLASKEITAR